MNGNILALLATAAAVYLSKQKPLDAAGGIAIPGGGSLPDGQGPLFSTDFIPAAAAAADPLPSDTYWTYSAPAAAAAAGVPNVSGVAKAAQLVQSILPQALPAVAAIATTPTLAGLAAVELPTIAAGAIPAGGFAAIASPVAAIFPAAVAPEAAAVIPVAAEVGAAGLIGGIVGAALPLALVVAAVLDPGEQPIYVPAGGGTTLLPAYGGGWVAPDSGKKIQQTGPGVTKIASAFSTEESAQIRVAYQ